MSSTDKCAIPDWRFSHFGLIVTGKTEAKCIPDFFRLVAATGMCSFRVIRKIGQRSPITAEKRRLRMIGAGKIIPNKDESEIGFPARNFLSSKASFVILIDDLEAGRSTSVKKIFDRYRLALDTILKPSQSRRASVHFLVNMLEAYYLADSRAVNSVLDTELEDYEGDVETVLNPKSRMKNLYPGFDEVNDGCRIIGSLSVSHVLSRQDACSCLRTMFAWIYKAIGQPECELRDLVVGRYDDVTKGQILELPP